MSCVDKFGERMNEIIDKYRAVFNSLTPLLRAGIVFEEDVYFAGLLGSDCKKYRYGNNMGIIGICDSALFEVANIATFTREDELRPLHNVLVELYSKLPPRSLFEIALLERDRVDVSLRIIYPGMGAGYVKVLLPKRELRSVARRFHIPTPGLGVDLESEFVAIELSIDKHHFAIKYSGREGRAYLEGSYPQGFENSPIACAVTDATTRIITDAVNLFMDIVNRGIKFVSIYLLY
jgi:hypothetical protein